MSSALLYLVVRLSTKNKPCSDRNSIVTDIGKVSCVSLLPIWLLTPTACGTVDNAIFKVCMICCGGILESSTFFSWLLPANDSIGICNITSRCCAAARFEKVLDKALLGRIAKATLAGNAKASASCLLLPISSMIKAICDALAEQPIHNRQLIRNKRMFLLLFFSTSFHFDYNHITCFC